MLQKGRLEGKGEQDLSCSQNQWRQLSWHKTLMSQVLSLASTFESPCSGVYPQNTHSRIIFSLISLYPNFESMFLFFPQQFLKFICKNVRRASIMWEQHSYVWELVNRTGLRIWYFPVSAVALLCALWQRINVMRGKETLSHLLDTLFRALTNRVSATAFHWLWLNDLDKEKEVSGPVWWKSGGWEHDCPHKEADFNLLIFWRR